MWCSERFATTASNGPGIGELLQRHAAEQVALRRGGVDREHVVAEARHRVGERAAPAADLEHAGGGGGQVGGDEGLEVHISEVVPCLV